MDHQLTAQVKKKAFDLGVDLIGVGNIERWANAPLLMSPRGLMPTAKSVVVCAIHHTDAMIEIGGENSPHEQGTYVYQLFMNNHLDFLFAYYPYLRFLFLSEKDSINFFRDTVRPCILMVLLPVP